ncbi:hypothetical protein LEP1GSC050_0369 [Leptospira broomii serovar Hurstbridge str. 5399]|uniref:Uncharacterized protein n=1 Tax=Leptospira broomii serovar Hurstbridge str. 5399 TaxID=1049789 RepID=T0FF19_9LEPT|nr:hypothetical protein LEP1GSC050_0369 [Leptospira broomii serovar Hurstbridge str. 5399]
MKPNVLRLFQMFLFEKNNPGLIADDLTSRIQFFGNNKGSIQTL